jgi:hypothetical protein
MENRELLIFIISSPLMDEEYPRLLPDYEGYEQRFSSI